MKKFSHVIFQLWDSGIVAWSQIDVLPLSTSRRRHWNNSFDRALRGPLKGSSKSGCLSRSFFIRKVNFWVDLRSEMSLQSLKSKWNFYYLNFNLFPRAGTWNQRCRALGTIDTNVNYYTRGEERNSPFMWLEQVTDHVEFLCILL